MRFPTYFWQSAICSTALIAFASCLLHRAKIQYALPSAAKAQQHASSTEPSASTIEINDREEERDDLSEEQRKASAKDENAALLERILFLARLPSLRALARDQVPILAAASRLSRLSAGESQLFDSSAGELSIIISGEASLSTTPDREQPQVAKLECGDFFGGILGKTADITVVAKTDVSLLVMPFDKVCALGLRDKLVAASKEATDQCANVIQRTDLVKIGLLGCGGFAAVELHQHKVSKDIYAQKGVSKGYLKKVGMQNNFFNEKYVLSMTSSPFIIRLFETYNGSQSLYLLLEAALGGELYAIYNRHNLHGSEEHCRFYIAGAVLAFEHLHDRSVVYRSLKPENIVLDDKGYPKLVDFDLAKFIKSRTYTTCGTPDYFSPELISNIGHGPAVDWWTVGVLAFELMSGSPPFAAAYPMQVYSKVMKGIGKVVFPEACQGSCADLIRRLMVKEPSERLAMLAGGSGNVRKHRRFRGFDWSGFSARTLRPPHEPTVASSTDLSNYRASEADRPRMVAYEDDGSGWDGDFAGML